MRKKSPSASAQRGHLTPHDSFELRLYIAGNAPNSQLAMTNLASICAEFLAGRFQLETIDVLTTPLRALADGVLVTPSLTVSNAGSQVRVIGNLNDRNGVLLAMGIK